MQKIEAIIRVQRLEAVQEALSDIGVDGVTVTEVKGMGRHRGITHTFRGSQYSVNLAPRIKLDLAVNDDQVDEIVDAIQEAAFTGEVGDGKIFVSALAQVVRIRTNERGDAALS
jgi:nitrogen regulatory protein PII